MHSKCVPQGDDGALLIPAALVQWENQIATPYSELSEAEKESDREQVRKYLPLIVSALGSKSDRPIPSRPYSGRSVDFVLVVRCCHAAALSPRVLDESIKVID
jgi:hypothetical protein